MNPFEQYTSPGKPDEHVARLLEKLGLPESLPVRVDLRVENYAWFLNCYGNVREKVRRDGGEIVYGWAILNYRITYEAEHHAVWKSPEGELIDITPREDYALSYMMFVEDVDQPTGTKIVDNVRINVTANRLVDLYMEICSQITQLSNLGKLINGELMIDRNAGIAYQTAHEMKRELARFIWNGGTYKAPCCCGQDKRFKNCHGQMIREDLAYFSRIFGLE